MQAPATVTVLALNGTDGNYFSTPDIAANSLTGDFDLRAKVKLTDWTSTGGGAGGQILVTKRWSNIASVNYEFMVNNIGRLYLGWVDTAERGASSTAAVPFTDGTTGWIRATMDVNNGSGGHTVTFYTSTDGSSWTQLGTPVTSAGTITVTDSGSPVYIGSRSTSAYKVTGQIYWVEIRNGIDGSVVAKFDPSAVAILGTRNPTTVVASTGETWTATGSAWDWAAV